jgi:hypothetical protein
VLPPEIHFPNKWIIGEVYNPFGEGQGEVNKKVQVSTRIWRIKKQ